MPLKGSMHWVAIILRVSQVTAAWGGKRSAIARIISAASTEDVPRRLADQLEDSGIMILPIGGERSEQRIVKVVRRSDEFEIEDLGDVRFVPLVEGIPGRPAGD